MFGNVLSEAVGFVIGLLELKSSVFVIYSLCRKPIYIVYYVLLSYKPITHKAY